MLDSRTGRRSSVLPHFLQVPTRRGAGRPAAHSAWGAVGDARDTCGTRAGAEASGRPCCDYFHPDAEEGLLALCFFYVPCFGFNLGFCFGFANALPWSAHSPAGPNRPAPSCVNVPGVAAAAGPSSRRLWSLRVSSFVSDAS